MLSLARLQDSFIRENACGAGVSFAIISRLEAL
jgi:hypothetical protein